MKIKKITKKHYKGKVHNFGCSEDHTYFAENVLVHNCGAGDSFIRSLHSDEIISQPLKLLEDTGVDPSKIEKLQIMFMSMGEPMLNQKALIPVLTELYEKFPNASLLISTSAPDVDYEKFTRLSVEIPTIGLQFSVHESTDEAREKLIPFKAKLELIEIAEKGLYWHVETGRRPYFNYCVHEDNKHQEDVDRLTELFPPHIWESTVSVVCERDEHVSASNERQRELANTFMERLLLKGYSTRMFDPAGQDDIGGGCGQLWFVQEFMENNPALAKKSIGNGLPVVHTPQKQ